MYKKPLSKKINKKPRCKQPKKTRRNHGKPSLSLNCPTFLLCLLPENSFSLLELFLCSLSSMCFLIKVPEVAESLHYLPFSYRDQGRGKVPGWDELRGDPLPGGDRQARLPSLFLPAITAQLPHTRTDQQQTRTGRAEEEGQCSCTKLC